MQGGFVFHSFHIALAHVADAASQKAACAAAGVHDDLARLGVDTVHHKGGNGPGRVELACVACGLQVVEHLLVDVAKVFALGQVVEVDLGDFVDHLADELAVFHVVVGVFKHGLDHTGAVGPLTRGG